jgi:hypothetical protein
MDADHHRQIVAAWKQYKPVTADTIRRELLSVGKLTFYDEARRIWYASRYPRLLVPLIVGSRIVGFRGRAFERGDSGPKWITSSYSEQALLGLGNVQPGSTVVWCENVVDRLLIEQDTPAVAAIAAGGLSWPSSWITALAKREPARVVIWFDHDLAGNGGGADRPQFIRQWLAEVTARRRASGTDERMPMPTAPESRGQKLLAELRAAGVNAELYAWPTGTPRKADVGWYLEDRGRGRPR